MCKHFSSLCRSSLCDQIRLLYFKISSCGALTYTGVPSTSATNSNHRFSNGAQLKVPAYLGGVSIFVCFVIALLSLGLSFAIVPRQVMPWTGLLLVYEWTFTLFILLFGGFLNLIYQWGRTVAFQEGSFSSHGESVDYGSGKGHQRQASACDFVTWYYLWNGDGIFGCSCPLFTMFILLWKHSFGIFHGICFRTPCNLFIFERP